jgi:pilus assembly protein Flp/PilA
MALAAARSVPNLNRAEAAEGHSQAWPSHHEQVNLASFLSTRKKATEVSRNHQTIRSKKMIRNFFRDETGLELSEYAVAAALVAIAVVAAFTALGTAISNKVNTLAATITG